MERFSAAWTFVRVAAALAVPASARAQEMVPGTFVILALDPTPHAPARH
jgi:hypothetical protein